MSRSGYHDGDDGSQWDMICWRGAVASAINGKRGQAFLREMREALEALPEKKLERSVLVADGACCAMGAVAIKRGLDTSDVDPYERDQVADLFGIAEALAAEIAYENDEDFHWSKHRTPEERWKYMHRWVSANIRGDNDGK
jgi:hypothetical protein